MKIFECIDSPNKAYIFGFFISDGYILKPDKLNKKPNYILGFEIHKRDIEILDFIQKELNFHILSKQERKNCIRLIINSTKLVKPLLNLGFTNNKTFTVKVPNIDDSLKKDLLRGMIDGDGWITTYKDRRYKIEKDKYTIGICGNKFVLDWVIDFISENISSSFKPKMYHPKNKNEQFFQITYSSINDIKEIKKLLYYDNCFRLKRKFNM